MMRLGPNLPSVVANAAAPSSLLDDQFDLRDQILNENYLPLTSSALRSSLFNLKRPWTGLDLTKLD